MAPIQPPPVRQVPARAPATVRPIRLLPIDPPTPEIEALLSRLSMPFHATKNEGSNDGYATVEESLGSSSGG